MEVYGALLLGVLLLAGCATGQSASPAMAAGSDRVCVKETPIGSHLPQRTCRSRAEVEAERKSAQDALIRVRDAPSASTTTQ